MSQGNELVSQDATERLDIKTGECVLEVGPGNGHGIEKNTFLQTINGSRNRN